MGAVVEGSDRRDWRQKAGCSLVTVQRLRSNSPYLRYDVGLFFLRRVRNELVETRE